VSSYHGIACRITNFKSIDSCTIQNLEYEIIKIFHIKVLITIVYYYCSKTQQLMLLVRIFLYLF